jgi:glycosyltransferase involved in cell wall biosynthesis
MSSKILFLKLAGFSNINDAVFKILESEYPECEIETIDVWQLIKHETSIFHLLTNIYFFFKEYGIDLIVGKKKLREWSQWFFATSYISILMSKKIKTKAGDKEYKFTLQTQSLFNGKIENIPHYIYTDHTTKTNLLYPGIHASQYMRSKRFIEKSEIKTYQDATMIFTFGKLVADSIVTQYQIPKERVLVVHSGSNVTNDIPNNDQKYFYKNILFVGVDWKRKGGPTLLKVFKNVVAKHPDASLTIIGCNPKKITLPNCNVVGRIPVVKICDYYNLASIFCLPTMREPFGVVFVEAMSFRLPVIANNIGSIPEMIKNDYNGYLIDNNIDSYTEAICQLFDNPEKCREMGENGYKTVISKFNWATVGRLMKQEINKYNNNIMGFSALP